MYHSIYYLKFEVHNNLNNFDFMYENLKHKEVE